MTGIMIQLNVLVMINSKAQNLSIRFISAKSTQIVLQCFSRLEKVDDRGFTEVLGYIDFHPDELLIAIDVQWWIYTRSYFWPDRSSFIIRL